MNLVLAVDFLAAGILLFAVLAKGFERTLPLAAFLLLLFPYESQIRIPGLFDLTTQRILIIELVVLYLALGRTRNGEGGTEKLPQWKLILLLVGWMLFSSANSVVPLVSFKSTLSQVFDFAVPYYIFARAISKAETVHKILFAFFASMCVLSVFGYFEIYQGWSVLSLFPVAPHRFAGMPGEVTDRGLRAQATFGTSIMFGTALAVAIPMGLYLLTTAKSTGRKVFLWSAVLLMFLDIYKTGSRGAWIAMILSLAMLFSFGRGSMRRMLATIVILTAMVLIVRPGVGETIVNLYRATQNPNTDQGASYQWRYALYGIAKRELSKDLGRALWGFGPESFYFLGLEGEFQGAVWKFETCDSEVVELLMDTGCVGFLIVATLLARAAFFSFRNSQKMTSPASTMCLVLFVNILTFCFMMTNVEIFWGQQSYMLWILMALSLIYPKLALSASKSEEPAAIGHQSIGSLAF